MGPENHGRPSIDQQVTFLLTSDLAATAHFYEDVLGLPLVLDQGSCRIYQVNGNAFIGFCERADSVLLCESGRYHERWAARTYCGSLNQLPPRRTRY